MMFVFFVLLMLFCLKVSWLLFDEYDELLLFDLLCGLYCMLFVYWYGNVLMLRVWFMQCRNVLMWQYMFMVLKYRLLCVNLNVGVDCDGYVLLSGVLKLMYVVYGFVSVQWVFDCVRFFSVMCMCVVVSCVELVLLLFLQFVLLQLFFVGDSGLGWNMKLVLLVVQNVLFLVCSILLLFELISSF